ncbi:MULTISPECIES: hypothetical protein [unclassified Bartonella]
MAWNRVWLVFVGNRLWLIAAGTLSVDLSCDFVLALIMIRR